MWLLGIDELAGDAEALADGMGRPGLLHALPRLPDHRRLTFL
jgi:hypothetical protein